LHRRRQLEKKELKNITIEDFSNRAPNRSNLYVSFLNRSVAYIGAGEAFLILLIHFCNEHYDEKQPINQI
jgi:hypothetical protein